jgi:peptidoglycan/xylan/chitin deacetylase (PgdA/CDA1 family)
VRRVRDIISRLLDDSPAVAGLRYRLSTRAEDGGFTILMYHRILEGPDPFYFFGVELPIFESQMAMLSRCCAVLPLDDIADLVERGRPLPRRCVALTFDDGYRDLSTLGSALLERYRLPATVYATVQGLDRGYLWPDLLRHALRTSREAQVRLDRLADGGAPVFSLASETQRIASLRQIAARLKQMENSQKDLVLEELTVKLLGGAPDDVAIPRTMLSWTELEALARGGMHVGAHTLTHPILSRLSEAECEREIRGSMEALTRRLGVPVRHFAYPNGQAEDISPAVRRIAEAAGARTACTAMYGFNRRGQDPMALWRIDGNKGSAGGLGRAMANAAR